MKPAAYQELTTLGRRLYDYIESKGGYVTTKQMKKDNISLRSFFALYSRGLAVYTDRDDRDRARAVRLTNVRGLGKKA